MEEFHHLPGGTNPTDISTKGKGCLPDILEEPGQSCVSLLREAWPVSRMFVR